MDETEKDISCVELKALINLLMYAGECAKEIGAEDLLIAIMTAQEVAKKEMKSRAVAKAN